MGGISTGVHTNPTHGNVHDFNGCVWCVVVVVVAHCWVVDQQTQRFVIQWWIREDLLWWWGVGCWLHPGTLLKLAVAGGGGVGGLLFVNYIVDASIFERRARMIAVLLVPLGSDGGVVVGVWCVFLMIICVVWRISCYGHTVDALASGADEGRGNLR